MLKIFQCVGGLQIYEAKNLICWWCTNHEVVRSREYFKNIKLVLWRNGVWADRQTLSKFNRNIWNLVQVSIIIMTRYSTTYTAVANFNRTRTGQFWVSPEFTFGFVVFDDFCLINTWDTADISRRAPSCFANPPLCTRNLTIEARFWAWKLFCMSWKAVGLGFPVSAQLDLVYRSLLWHKSQGVIVSHRGSLGGDFHSNGAASPIYLNQDWQR